MVSRTRRLADVLRAERRRLADDLHRSRSGLGGSGAPRAVAGFVVAKTVALGHRCLRRAAETVVDRRYGIRTAGMLRPDSPGDTPDPHAAYAYQPVGLRRFRAVVRACATTPSATTFLDLGCGRGRALALAREHGFARVVGVELDPGLARTARANLAAGGSTAVVVHTGDAATTAVPAGPLLVFLFNPFGPAVLRRVLDRVAEQASGPVTVGYVNPVHRAVLDDDPRWERTVTARWWSVHRLRRPPGPHPDDTGPS